jgi:L-amino acid N-acyltransferase YncA
VINEDSPSSDGLDSGHESSPSGAALSDIAPLVTSKHRKFKDWAQRCPKEDARDLSLHCGADCPTLVSRNWSLYGTIEGLPREEFWKRLQEMKGPDDLDTGRPWWDDALTDHAGGQYLAPFGRPGSPSVSAQKASQQDAEIPEEKEKFSASNHVETMSSSKMELRKREEFWGLRTQEELWSPVVFPGSSRSGWGQLPDPVKTKADVNIYIRDGCSSDVEDVLRVYNGLVKHTWWTLDSLCLTAEDLSAQLDLVTSKNLPWIVAVKPKTGLLVGFALVDDVGTRRGFMNTSASIEVYVDRGHQHQGVGKALLDRLLSRVEHKYKRQCRTRVRDKADRKRAADIIRYKSIQVLIAHVPYHADDYGDMVRMNWLRKWLARFGFERSAVIPSAMCRKGKMQVHPNAIVSADRPKASMWRPLSANATPTNWTGYRTTIILGSGHWRNRVERWHGLDSIEQCKLSLGEIPESVRR